MSSLVTGNSRAGLRWPPRTRHVVHILAPGPLPHRVAWSELSEGRVMSCGYHWRRLAHSGAISVTQLRPNIPTQGKTKISFGQSDVSIYDLRQVT